MRRAWYLAGLLGLLLFAAACGPRSSGGPDAGREADAAIGTDGGVTPDSGSPPDGSVDPCPGGQALFDDLVAGLAQEVQQQGVPGAALAVVCGGQVTYAEGVGVTREGGSDPVTASTRFQIASVTKMFTAAAALSLRDQGTLDLHAPLATWVPYTNTTQPFGQAITLHHLLTHTAGYATEWPQGTYWPYEIPDLFVNNADEPLWAPPGETWLYSNLGFSLAGLVIQEAAGADFRDVVEQRIFVPAGLTGASMHADQVASQGSFAYGHSEDPTYPNPVPPTGAYFADTAYGPMGGAWMSVEDLARWGLAHLARSPAVLSQAAWTDLRALHSKTLWGPAEYYGYGVFIDDLGEDAVLSHGGGTVGFSAQWQLVPERGFGVFFLTNCEWYWPGDLLDQAMTDFIDFQYGDPTPYLSDPADWPDYEGTYNDPVSQGDIQVEVRTGRLWADFLDLGFEAELTGYYVDSYSYYSPVLGFDETVTFWRDPGQPAEYLVSLSGIAIRVQ